MKHLGLLAVLVALGCLGLVMKMYYQKGIRSTSQVVASHKSAYLLFASIMSAAGLLNLIFMERYFIPVNHLSVWFRLLMWTVTLLMWITVWVPAGGKHDRFHHTTAFSMAFNMVYLVALLAMHHQFSIGLQLANAAIVITMISLMAKSVFVSDKAYIYYQQAYFICFWGAIVLSTYVR